MCPSDAEQNSLVMDHSLVMMPYPPRCKILSKHCRRTFMYEHECGSTSYCICMATHITHVCVKCDKNVLL